MNDIVERLRNDQGIGINLTLCREAADEIERLRAGGCARNQRTTQFCAEAADANTRANAAEARAVEAERERDERAAPCQIGGCKYGDLQRQLAAAREVLKLYACRCRKTCLDGVHDCWRRKARAALATGGDDE